MVLFRAQLIGQPTCRERDVIVSDDGIFGNVPQKSASFHKTFRQVAAIAHLLAR